MVVDVVHAVDVDDRLCTVRRRWRRRRRRRHPGRGVDEGYRSTTSPSYVAARRRFSSTVPDVALPDRAGVASPSTSRRRCRAGARAADPVEVAAAVDEHPRPDRPARATSPSADAEPASPVPRQSDDRRTRTRTAEVTGASTAASTTVPGRPRQLVSCPDGVGPSRVGDYSRTDVRPVPRGLAPVRSIDASPPPRRHGPAPGAGRPTASRNSFAADLMRPRPLVGPMGHSDCGRGDGGPDRRPTLPAAVVADW